MSVSETKAKIRVRMKMIRVEQDWSIDDMCAVTGDKPSTLKNKLCGINTFNLDDVIKVSEASGRSFDYICGRSDS